MKSFTVTYLDHLPIFHLDINYSNSLQLTIYLSKTLLKDLKQAGYKQDIAINDQQTCLQTFLLYLAFKSA
jgi:hypothetical protein